MSRQRALRQPFAKERRSTWDRFASDRDYDRYQRNPRWQGEGNTYDNIPRMAMVTGNVDALDAVR